MVQGQFLGTLDKAQSFPARKTEKTGKPTFFKKISVFKSDIKTDLFFEFSDVQNLGRKLTRPSKLQF